jgi:hypothetical protein
MSHYFARAVAAAALLLCAACQDSAAPAQDLPTTLSIWPDPKAFGLGLGTTIHVLPTLLSARGDTLPVPPGLVLVSRNPAAVSVDSGTYVTGRSLSTTWVVATLPVGREVLRDSVQVLVTRLASRLAP